MADKNKKDTLTYVDIPDPFEHCYIEKWIRKGGQRSLSYPKNSLPKTTEKEAFVETAFLRVKS